MVMTVEKREEINNKLEEIMDYCLYCHSDSVAYQICEILKEVIDSLPVML